MLKKIQLELLEFAVKLSEIWKKLNIEYPYTGRNECILNRNVKENFIGHDIISLNCCGVLILRDKLKITELYNLCYTTLKYIYIYIIHSVVNICIG